jgi:hypothetical protein
VSALRLPPCRYSEPHSTAEAQPRRYYLSEPAMWLHRPTQEGGARQPSRCHFALLFVFAPGLIYMIAMSGYNYVCPRCGVHIRGGRHD